MQNAGDQKLEMEELKKSAAEENKVLEKRKKAIDAEMAEVCSGFLKKLTYFMRIMY